jgi:hypothetical protein
MKWKPGQKSGAVRHLRSVVLAGLVAAACSDPAGPSDPSFSFTVKPVFGVRRSPPEVEVGKSFLLISGIFEVPHPLFTITGWLVQPEPFKLQLGVRGNPTSDGPTFTSLHLYQSRIGNLPKGNYALEIIYVVNKGALRDSTLVYSNTFTIR